ncbi:hypothetical protein JTB14_036383 [Gonioctena quinquepunctata]|nr:hypothetical protein JTB14_036383 [Gonioctena quinquepunctata]
MTSDRTASQLELTDNISLLGPINKEADWQEGIDVDWSSPQGEPPVYGSTERHRSGFGDQHVHRACLASNWLPFFCVQSRPQPENRSDMS